MYIIIPQWSLQSACTVTSYSSLAYKTSTCSASYSVVTTLYTGNFAVSGPVITDLTTETICSVEPLNIRLKWTVVSVSPLQ